MVTAFLSVWVSRQVVVHLGTVTRLPSSTKTRGSRSSAKGCGSLGLSRVMALAVKRSISGCHDCEVSSEVFSSKLILQKYLAKRPWWKVMPSEESKDEEERALSMSHEQALGCTMTDCSKRPKYLGNCSLEMRRDVEFWEQHGILTHRVRSIWALQLY